MSRNMRDFPERPPQGSGRVLISIRVVVTILVTIIVVLLVTVTVLVSVVFRPLLSPTSSTPTAISGGSTPQDSTPSQSVTTQNSCLTKIGGGGINQGNTLTTDPNKWTIIRGDVAYTDPNTGSQVFVKSANGDDPNAQDIGALLAVRGTVAIYGVNQAGYDLYPRETTIDQIKQELNCDKNSMINYAGCLGKCRNVSEVLIDGKSVMLLGG